MSTTSTTCKEVLVRVARHARRWTTSTITIITTTITNTTTTTCKEVPGAFRGCIGAGESGKTCKEVDDGEQLEEKS